MGCTNSKPQSHAGNAAAAEAAPATEKNTIDKKVVVKDSVTPAKTVDIVSAPVNENAIPGTKNEAPEKADAVVAVVEKALTKELVEEEVVEATFVAVTKQTGGEKQEELVESLNGNPLKSSDGANTPCSEDDAANGSLFRDVGSMNDSLFRDVGSIKENLEDAEIVLQIVEERDQVETSEITMDDGTSSPKEWDLPTKKGFIARQCKDFEKGWKSRFFVLEKGTLHFYESDSPDAPFGVNKEGGIVLNGATITSKENKITLKSSKSSDMLMDIRLKGERLLWIRAIEDHIAHYYPSN